MMITELSLGCWSSGHRKLYMYQVSSSTVFSLLVTCTFIMYCSRLFVVVFQEMNCLHTSKPDVVRRVAELHLFTEFHDSLCYG